MLDTNDLYHGIEEVVPEGGLDERLKNEKALVVKVGFDPTTQDLHLGHTLLLHKASQFQKLGHTVVVIIGDFTARIGDPSGKSATRPVLDAKTVKENGQFFIKQVQRILDPTLTKIVMNSTWYDDMTAEQLIQLCTQFTVARMLERNDFSERFSANMPLGIHEFIYPILQGYDSVKIKADVELGGTDQKFNLLMGRTYQKHHQMAQQVVMMMPLLEGTDGVKKMSKSYDNHISISNPPKEMYGQLMAISDQLMWRYLDLIPLFTKTEVLEWQRLVEQGENPKNIKMKLAKRCVSAYYDDEQAEIAEQSFISLFQKNTINEDELEQVSLSSLNQDGTLAYHLKLMGLVSSTSEGNRMIQSGAVKINDEKISDRQFKVNWSVGDVVRVGKRRIKKISL
ncbi:MAG: tyrosine--tRNA ligase [Candidatus Comchoanobacterales bacterium]